MGKGGGGKSNQRFWQITNNKRTKVLNVFANGMVPFFFFSFSFSLLHKINDYALSPSKIPWMTRSYLHPPFHVLMTKFLLFFLDDVGVGLSTCSKEPVKWLPKNTPHKSLVSGAGTSSRKRRWWWCLACHLRLFSAKVALLLFISLSLSLSLSLSPFSHIIICLISHQDRKRRNRSKKRCISLSHKYHTNVTCLITLLIRMWIR